MKSANISQAVLFLENAFKIIQERNSSPGSHTTSLHPPWFERAVLCGCTVNHPINHVLRGAIQAKKQRNCKERVQTSMWLLSNQSHQECEDLPLACDPKIKSDNSKSVQNQVTPCSTRCHTIVSKMYEYKWIHACMAGSKTVRVWQCVGPTSKGNTSRTWGFPAQNLLLPNSTCLGKVKNQPAHLWVPHHSWPGFPPHESVSSDRWHTCFGHEQLTQP